MMNLRLLTDFSICYWNPFGAHPLIQVHIATLLKTRRAYGIKNEIGLACIGYSLWYIRRNSNYISFRNIDGLQIVYFYPTYPGNNKVTLGYFDEFMPGGGDARLNSRACDGNEFVPESLAISAIEHRSSVSNSGAAWLFLTSGCMVATKFSQAGWIALNKTKPSLLKPSSIQRIYSCLPSSYAIYGSR